MDDEELLFRAIDSSIAALERAGDDRRRLSEPVRTVFLLQAAQGIIDNGGLQYFFEADFEDHVSYEEFCDAYRRVGADDAAVALQSAVAMFPFDNPHLHREQRNMYLDLFFKDGSNTGPLAEFDDVLVGNESVWTKLTSYVNKHREEFGV
jgi:hypothetical protein